MDYEYIVIDTRHNFRYPTSYIAGSFRFVYISPRLEVSGCETKQAHESHVVESYWLTEYRSGTHGRTEESVIN